MQASERGGDQRQGAAQALRRARGARLDFEALAMTAVLLGVVVAGARIASRRFRWEPPR